MLRKSGRQHLVLTPAGPLPACELAKRLPARAWQRLSAGPGAKGPRWYDWALIEASDPAVTEGDGPHWLLIRRRISDGEYAFYRAHAPGPVPLTRLVRVAGSRWKVEDGFAASKELAPWTSIRSGAGPPGTAGPSWPCSPLRSCPSWPRPSLMTAARTMIS